jgi:hypothetical protein
VSTKHTPGKWSVNSERQVVADNGFVIADVRGPDFRERGDDRRESAAICAQNAFLISAAPDLLACLQDALASFANSVEGGEADEWVQFSRAAIRKAQGEEA